MKHIISVTLIYGLDRVIQSIKSISMVEFHRTPLTFLFKFYHRWNCKQRRTPQWQALLSVSGHFRE